MSTITERDPYAGWITEAPDGRTAEERAFERIANLGAAMKARADREAADARLNWLDEHIAIFAAPDPRHGHDGFDDISVDLMSARHWMVVRAKTLRVARTQQLTGHCAKGWLEKAARNRRTEKMYRNAERRAEYTDLIFGAATSNLIAAE